VNRGAGQLMKVAHPDRLEAARKAAGLGEAS
jgi:hypothetical protein